MIFVCNEKKAETIFNAYRDVAAFSLGKSNGYVSEDGKIKVSFRKATFLPDNDMINAALNGDQSPKKVLAKLVKKATKAIEQVSIDPDDPDETGIALAMLEIVSMIANNHSIPEGLSKKQFKKWMKNDAPNILVFVLDGEDEARDKFLTKYIAALFEVYGLKVITKGKVIKSIFGKDGKPKSVKKAIMSLTSYMEKHESCSLSKKGQKLIMRGQIYYKLELQNLAVINTIGSIKAGEEFEISEKGANRLIKLLIENFSDHNVLALCDMGMDKKKYLKPMHEKNIATWKAYKECAKILEHILDVELPKTGQGCTKKSKKDGTFIPKTNVKKFKKFFLKKGNRKLLPILLMHMAFVYMGDEVGSKSYVKEMTKVLSACLPEKSKEFITVVKQLNAAKASN